MLQFNINPKLIKSALTACPKNDVRAYLNGVFIDIANRAVVATNGHWLVVHTVTNSTDKNMLISDTEGVENFIIPADVIKKALTASVCQRESVTLTYNPTDGTGVLHDTQFTAIDGKYPDWERVIPADKMTPSPVRQMISFVILKGVYDCLKATGYNKDVGFYPDFLNGNANEPMLQTLNSIDGIETKIVIMPMKVA